MSWTVERSGEVCVVGVGAATAVGETAPASAAAVRAGIAGFADHAYVIDGNGDPVVVASAPFLDEGVVEEDRLIHLARIAASEALGAIGGSPLTPHSIPAFVGIPAVRPGLPADLDGRLSTGLAALKQDGCRVSGTQIIPCGHSAGLIAAKTACEKIRNEEAEFCLVGGADSYIVPEALEWIDDCEQLHNATNAYGFVPGEAAGFLLLCSDEVAGRLQLSVLGRLVTIGVTEEKNRIKTDTVCIGEGLTRAVQQALEALPDRGMRIDYTICDMNGEAYRADEFGFMLARTAERFVDGSDFLTPADCWGDVGAASGPLFIVLAAAAARKGYGKGPLTLLWTSSEGGERAAAVLHAEVQTGGPAR
jgi:3-oxoacyl-[acyl-carrier-protein] synthase-1